MSPLPYDPNFRPPEEETFPGASTDLHSLQNQPDPGFEALLTAEEPRQPKQKELKTDFESLGGKEFSKVVYTQPRSATDWLIDGLTPLMIFIMVYSVIFFLLDVRYVYTEVHDLNLRFVAFAFVMGVVALNRLIARDGSDESILYMGGLAGAIGFYTFATTGAFDVGAVSRNFMNSNAYLATAFNMCIVAFIWWLVNRLTHECSVDENRTAGDVGILTGTARRLQAGFQRQPPEPKPKKLDKSPIVPMYEIEAYDPTEGYKPKPKAQQAVASASDRLSGRHPGISIFFFSVPVFFVFAVGLRVVQHGGPMMVLAGQFYMGIYTVSALMLLMLTSLGGLREYFRARKVAMPDGIGWFWIGLGVVMIAVVLVGAAQLPKPSLPGIAYVDQHQTDYWSRGSTFELSRVSATPVEILQQSRFMDRVGQAVLGMLGLFVIYAALKALAGLAGRIARQRDRYPRFVVRFFDRLDWLLTHLTRLPALPQRKRRIRVQRQIATSTGYRNSMGDPEQSAVMKVSDHVEYAYQALCALAYDLGVPRQEGQTPYEFIRSFPNELRGLQEEARELTRLYVVAAYSDQDMDARVQDRLRRFWVTYNRIRSRLIR